jgi:hypothetical protein
VLRNGMEAYFHLVHTHVRPATEDVRAWFADQLKLHGRERSLQGQRLWRDAGGRTSVAARAAFAEAVSLFDEAVRYERDDAYAYHYRAFNRDAIADAPAAVEADYEHAIELEPDVTWWHSRLCTHLMARGRRADARRVWAQALEACIESDEQELAEHLHRWALRWALEFGDLEFAREIRDATNPDVVHGDAREQFDAMLAWLERMASGAADRDVLPSRIAADRLGGKPILFGEREVRDWTNARIQAVEPEQLVLRCAGPFRPGDATPIPTFDSTLMDIDAVLAASRDNVGRDDLVPGRFLEIAHKLDGELAIGFFDDRAWSHPGLPKLFPDPLRYGDAWLGASADTVS